MRATITIDDRLMERIDEFADKNYMSRSGLITVACNQYLNQNEVVFVMRNIGNVMQRLLDTGKVEPEMIDELKHYTELLKMIIQ